MGALFITLNQSRGRRSMDKKEVFRHCPICSGRGNLKIGSDEDKLLKRLGL